MCKRCHTESQAIVQSRGRNGTTAAPGDMPTQMTNGTAPEGGGQLEELFSWLRLLLFSLLHHLPQVPSLHLSAHVRISLNSSSKKGQA